MTEYKKWCKLTLIITVIGLMAIAGFNMFIDPFFHYHKPYSWISYSFGNQNYVNSGIVRQFDYDTLITGTSMTENFRPSLFHEVLGDQAVKVPFSGGQSRNFKILIDTALKTNPEIKRIYMGLDLNMLDDENPGQPREPFPAYLYDNNPFTDVSYLLNKTVLIQNTGTFLVDTIQGISSDTFDDYSFWRGSDDELGRFVETFDFDRQIDSLPRDELLALAREHLELNVIPLVESHPDVEFVLFFPPYSILYWYDKELEDIMAVLEYAIETLIFYDNVRLYLPMNNADIVTNLNNYRDAGHYSPAISDYLVYCFREGTHLLTVENYEGELRKLVELVEGFDYSAYYQ